MLAVMRLSGDGLGSLLYSCEAHDKDICIRHLNLMPCAYMAMILLAKPVQCVCPAEVSVPRFENTLAPGVSMQGTRRVSFATDFELLFSLAQGVSILLCKRQGFGMGCRGRGQFPFPGPAL